MLYKPLILIPVLLHSVAIHTQVFHTEYLFESSVVSSSISSAAGRSPITIAAGFLGAFIVGSLAVQLVRSQTASIPAGAAAVEPVIASPATLWAPLAQSDVMATAPSKAPVTVGNADPIVKPVVGSEATLWAPLSDR